MQTALADFIRDTESGKEANAILRTCVHCGMCNATCPTYQLLGDELDGPRGRIYLIKQALEGHPVTERTRLHLDRCLTCRACETTCPSGVRYGRLADIGRGGVEAHTRRGALERAWRAVLSVVMPRTALFGALLRFGQLVRPLLPPGLRALIDAWWPLVESNEIEAIVVTASGCGVTVKDYVHLLAHDPAYRDKAKRISGLAKDLCEVVPAEAIAAGRDRGRIAFQSPCSLQHGQQIRGAVEALLARAGYQLAPVRDSHLCCGSAGTYSLLQPEIARELRARKLASLAESMPQAIASANLGCMVHLQSASELPVRHWIELLDEALAAQP